MRILSAAVAYFLSMRLGLGAGPAGWLRIYFIDVGGRAAAPAAHPPGAAE